MKYTAEEVRAIAKRLHDGITVADSDALMASDMLTANAALVEAMKLPDGYEVIEHLPGIWGYEYDRDDGERMASSASWNHPALAAIGAWRDHVEALAESAEPVAQGESAWLERLKDPATVHALMLRGVIAIPSIRSMVDLRGEVPNGEDAQLLRIAELQEQLAAQPRAVPDGWSITPEPNPLGGKNAMCLRDPSGRSALFGTFSEEVVVRDFLAALLAAAPSPGESA